LAHARWLKPPSNFFRVHLVKNGSPAEHFDGLNVCVATAEVGDPQFVNKMDIPVRATEWRRRVGHVEQQWRHVFSLGGVHPVILAGNINDGDASEQEKNSAGGASYHEGLPKGLVCKTEVRWIVVKEWSSLNRRMGAAEG
jgi:hypothetical protein